MRSQPTLAMLSARASVMLESSVHSPGGQTVRAAIPVPRHFLEVARVLELDGGAEGITDGKAE